MLSHFAKVVYRYLSRRAFFTALNVLGLSIAMGCCIIIYLFVSHEMAYDKFHAKGDRIFRLLRQSQMNGIPYDIGVTSAPFAEALLQDYQGRIESVTRALPFGALFQFQEKAFIENQMIIADSNFFQFFSYPLLRGEPSQVLSNGNSLVISKSLAEKYFGTDDPIGKLVRLDDQYDLIVTGVMDDVKADTHLNFDAVVSMNILHGEDWVNEWWNNAFFTYVLVTDPRDAQYLAQTFPNFMDKYFGKDFERVGNKIGLTLEPLHDIYFNYSTRYEDNVVHGDKRYVYIFGSIGVLLLLLGAINYSNLSTAQAATRAREVGIRKTLGSDKTAIAVQFLSESFALTAVSLLMAIGISQLSIPVLNNQFSMSIPTYLGAPDVVVFGLVMLVLMTLAAGSYPSFLLSSFKPVVVLKGEVKGDVRYTFIRKALVVFQFAISGFMISSTLFISDQLRYLRKMDLGFQPDQLMVVQLNNGLINRERENFMKALLDHDVFLSASLTSGIPGGFYDATTVEIAGETDNMRMRTLYTDWNYANTLDLDMLAGRFFSPLHAADTMHSAILNETAARQLGWKAEEAVGRRIRLSQFDSTFREVIGVIPDFHFASAKQKIEPLVIGYLNDRGNLLVRVSAGETREAISTLEETWQSFNTGFPIDFTFLDDVFARLYTNEVKQSRIFTLFSIISIAIACLGILGLTAFIASQRRKEMGIRKVLGASGKDVSALLVKDMLMLVLLANIIATPVVYFAIRKWLQGFAYSTDMHIGIFISGAAVVFLVAATIVWLNASRVARQNPADALRTE